MALLTNINGKFSVSDAGAVTFNNAFTFPTVDGTANYVLKTNGSGQLAWGPDNNSGDITGSGTANTVTKFTGAKVIGNGPITFSGNNSTFAGDISVASGTISVLGGNNMTLSGPASHGGISFGTNCILPATAAATNNNIFDLGATAERFKNLYLGSEIISGGGATFDGTIDAVGNITTDGIFKVDSAPDNNILEVDQSGRKMALKTSFAGNTIGSFWAFRVSTGATNGATTDALIVKPLQATFAGNLGVAGKTPAYGLNLAQGTGSGNKIAWTDVTPNFRASMWANSSDDKFKIATGNASSVETVALEIDTSQNATFSGNVNIINTGANPTITLVENSGGTQNAKIEFDQAGENALYISTNYISPSDSNRILLQPGSYPALTASGGANGSINTKVEISGTLRANRNIQTPNSDLSTGSNPTNFGVYTSEVRLIDTPNGGLKSCRVITDNYGEWILVGRFAASAMTSIQSTWSSESGLDTSTSQSTTTKFSADFGDSYPTEVRIMGATDFTKWRDTRTIDWIYGVPEGRQWKYFFSGGAANGMTSVGPNHSGNNKFGWNINGSYDGFGRWVNPAQTSVGMSDNNVTNPSAAYTTATTNAFNWEGASDAKMTVSATRTFSGQDSFETAGFGNDDNIQGFFDEYPGETNNMQGGVDFSSAVWVLIKLPNASSGGGGTSFWKANGNNIYNTNSGNVGIGTTTPLANLDIGNDSGSIYQRWSYDNPGANNYFLSLSETVTSGNVRFCFNQRNAGTNYNNVLVFNQGKVGIGKADPRAKGLEIFRAAGLSGTPQLIISTGESSSRDCSFATDVMAAGDFAILDGVASSAANVRMRFVGGGTTIAFRDNNTTELGRYVNTNSGGAIKRIRMRQGGEIHFGDTAVSSPLGITEGAWDTFTDQDFLSIYARNRLDIYTYPLGNTKTASIGRADGSSYILGSLGIGLTSVGNFSLRTLGAISGTNIYANSNGGGFVFGASTSEGEYITRPSGTSNMNFYTNGQPRIVIESGGQVGVNNTLPSATLHLTALTNNGVPFKLQGHTSTTVEQMLMYTSKAAATNWYWIVAQANSVNQLIIYGNGDIKNKNNSYGQISDVRLKENIVDAKPKLEDIKKLKVKNFNLIGDDLKQIGLIAQEVEEVFPGLVNEDKEPDIEGGEEGGVYKSVKYSVLVPILIKAMQEQQEIIDDLKSRIEQLEN
jgi:autotransporter-associated beta strand protein